MQIGAKNWAEIRAENHQNVVNWGENCQILRCYNAYKLKYWKGAKFMECKMEPTEQ